MNSKSLFLCSNHIDMFCATIMNRHVGLPHILFQNPTKLVVWRLFWDQRLKEFGLFFRRGDTCKRITRKTLQGCKKDKKKRKKKNNGYGNDCSYKELKKILG